MTRGDAGGAVKMQIDNGGRHATGTERMGSVLPSVCQPFDTMPAREKFSNFDKVKFGGDAQNIWSLAVTLVCKKSLICSKTQSEVIYILIKHSHFGKLF